MEQSLRLPTARFRRLFDEAVSFSGASPPDGSTYIGYGEHSGRMWHFWRGVRDPEEGEVILYATEDGMKLAKQLEDKKKKVRKGTNFKTYIDYNTQSP